jgi:hypothetical protein
MMADIVETTAGGFEILCLWARNIAMLPLEDWDRTFEKAESIGHIVDPTLYRSYIYSDKAKVIRKLIRAAIPLKQAVMEAQAVVLAEIGLHAHDDNE